MKTMLILIAGGLCFWIFSGMQQSEEKKKLFAVVYTTGPAWDTTKAPSAQKYFGFHGKHLGQWRKDGKILIGGRYSDKGLIVLQAKDEAEARMILETDSSVIAGTMKGELYPFAPFYEGCITK